MFVTPRGEAIPFIPGGFDLDPISVIILTIITYFRVIIWVLSKSKKIGKVLTREQIQAILQQQKVLWGRVFDLEIFWVSWYDWVDENGEVSGLESSF